MDVEVNWSLEHLDGSVVDRGAVKAQVRGESDAVLAKLDFASALDGDAIRQRVLVYEALIDGKPAGMGITSFVPSKHLELPDSKIDVGVKRDAGRAYLELRSDKHARFVSLSIPENDTIFSDNYFDLPAGRTMLVDIESEIDPGALSRIQVHSLRDSY